MTTKEDLINLIKQLNEYVNEIAGGFTLYLHQDASADIGGYLLLTADDPDDAKTDVGPFTITGNDQELEQWATAAGEPGLTVLQNGVYEVHGHAEKTAGVKDATLYAEIYKRAAGGAETLLGTSHHSAIIPGAETGFELHAAISEQIILVDDRLVVKLYGNQEGLGNDPVISVYVEGVTLSRLRVPVSIGDIGGAHPIEDDAYGAGWNGDTTNAPTQNAVYDEINLMNKPISPLHFVGENGFVNIRYWGAGLVVAFSDVNAACSATFYIDKAGDYDAYIIHDSSVANVGKTAGGTLYFTHDVDGGGATWDSNGAFNLPISSAPAQNIDKFSASVTLAANSKVAIYWVKNDNAGGAAGNMRVYGMFLIKVS